MYFCCVCTACLHLLCFISITTQVKVTSFRVSHFRISEGEDELTPPEPFYFDAGVHIAQEEETGTDQIPEPSPAPIPDDAIPSTSTSELEQPISQDSPTTQVLDLNEHAQEQPQEQNI
ncbi:hypothetical protein JHK85_007045 [Glycine max]|nr:hypothetical protein JHK85_007045 [Glycine max]